MKLLQKPSVSKYTGDDSVVRVPAKLNGYDTVLSGAVFFQNKKITEVSFALGVKLMGSVKNMFCACDKLQTVDMSEVDTSEVTDMSFMFGGCSTLTSLDVSGFDTGKVTLMEYMFSDCSNLSVLDVSSFDTSEVTNMLNMFSGCSGLTSLDVSGFDTGKVKVMAGMFEHCSGLTSLDVSRFNTKNVTSMNFMFNKCERLTAINVSGFDTSNVTNMYSMFSGCNSLTSLDVSGFDMSSVEDMCNMFSGCSNLKVLDVSGFGIGNKVAVMDSMFNGCSGLISLDISGFDMRSKVTGDTEMFRGCTNLRRIKTPKSMSSYDTNCPLPFEMYELKNGVIQTTPYADLTQAPVNSILVAPNDEIINDFVYTVDEGNHEIILTEYIGDTETEALYIPATISGNKVVLSGEHIFNHDFDSSTHTGSNTTLRSIIIEQGVIIRGNVSGMFANCTSLIYVDMSYVDFSEATDLSYMFYGCISLKYIIWKNIIIAGNVINVSYMFYNCPLISELDLSVFDFSGITGCSWFLGGCTGLIRIDTPTNVNTSLNIAIPVDMYEYVNGVVGNTPISNLMDAPAGSVIVVEGYVGDVADIVYSEFTLDDYEWEIQEDVIILQKYTATDKSNITVPAYVDHGGVRYSVALDHWDEGQGSIHIARGLFDSHTELINVKFESGVKFISCYGLFLDCLNLKRVILVGVDTSACTDMGNMFYGCHALTDLDVSGFDTSKVTSMSGMFSGCASLTELDVTGFDTSNVVNMMGMFAACNNLTRLDVSGFNTSKVTSMRLMFRGCYQLKSLDVSGFDTRLVTLMDEMFYGCSLLSRLDVSGFNTSQVTNMNRMFADCSKLTVLDVSGFDTANVTNMANMFLDCSGLKRLDVSGFVTTKVTSMYCMFAGCSSLVSIDISNFDTQNVLQIHKMFYGCSSLETLDIRHFNTNKVLSDQCYSMFTDCSSLTELKLCGFNISYLNGDFFAGCSSLTELDLSRFSFSDMTGNKTHNIFSGCDNLKKIKTPKAIGTGKICKIPLPQNMYKLYVGGTIDKSKGYTDLLKSPINSTLVTEDYDTGSSSSSSSGSSSSVTSSKKSTSSDSGKDSTSSDSRKTTSSSDSRKTTSSSDSGKTTSSSDSGKDTTSSERKSDNTSSDSDKDTSSSGSSKKKSSSSDGKDPGSSGSDKKSSSSSALPYYIDYSDLKEKAVEAQKKGFGAWDDTIVLSQSGKEFFLETTRQEELLTVVRGNKFTILGGEKGSFVSDNKKFVSVSKKGVVKAKRHFGKRAGVCISYRDAVSGQTVNIRVRVWEQVLFNTRVTRDDTLLYNVGSQKLKMKTEINRSFDFSSLILLNSDLAEPVNPGVIDNLRMEIGDDGRYHVRGNTIKRGTVKFPYRIYGKKFTVVIRVK